MADRDLHFGGTGAKDGIYLTFTSDSGVTSWVAVYPDETGINDIGRGLTSEQIVANYQTMFEAMMAANPDV